MFGKLFAGVAVAGILTGVLATGALAKTDGAPSASPAAKHHRANRDAFGGTVTAVSETQLTVRNHEGDSKTFLRTDKTQVFRGRDRVAWSEIEINTQVRVKFEERDGKLYARRIQLGRAHVRGKVESVDGNVITISARDGKDVKVTVNNDTKFFEGRGKGERKPGSLKDIHRGEHLIAFGRWDRNGSFDAAVVITFGCDSR